MAYVLKKPYINEAEKYDFIVKYNHAMQLLIEEDDYALYALEPNEMFVDGEVIINHNYNIEKANIVKNDLIENVNYSLKEKVAYTGVFFDFNDENLVFETNKNSMSLINFTLTQIVIGNLIEVKNWKCRKSTAPYEPYSVDFTAEQFTNILTFAGEMVNNAFAVEKEINSQIELLTTEQLINEEFVNNFKIKMKEAYDSIPIKIVNLF